MMQFWSDLFRPEMAFLRNALLVGALSSLALGVIGTLVVTRRISSIAGASAHAALGGVGVALFLQRVLMWHWCSPTLGAVVGAVASALLVGVVIVFFVALSRSYFISSIVNPVSEISRVSVRFKARL